MASTTAASCRCLSDLPDELLQHILGFVPSREAASTAVPRRWRGLWPMPAGAVNLDTRSSGGEHQAFFRGADAAIAAHGGSVRRLAVHIEDDDGPDSIQDFMSGSSWGKDCHCVNDVLRLPAIRAVEELSIGASYSNLPAAVAANQRCESAMPDDDEGLYDLSMDSIPSEALRVLRITNCSDHYTSNNFHRRGPPPATAFQCLEVLQLRRCNISLESLQDMIVATLVLLNCGHQEGVVIELDVPRMQQFR
uniref:F-box domain-containing protein n=1 Tax=Setaria italica TaxID=4555 RepID=K3ZMG8_SETIT